MDALAFGVAHPGLCLDHGLVLKSIHAGETTDDLLVEFHGDLRSLACCIFDVERCKAGLRACVMISRDGIRGGNAMLSKVERLNTPLPST